MCTGVGSDYSASAEDLRGVPTPASLARRPPAPRYQPGGQPQHPEVNNSTYVPTKAPRD
jgi:hypothetical protein